MNVYLEGKTPLPKTSQTFGTGLGGIKLELTLKPPPET